MIFVDKGLNFNLLCVNAGLARKRFQLREGFLAALLHKYLECKCERRVVVAVKLCCGVVVGFCP